MENVATGNDSDEMTTLISNYITANLNYIYRVNGNGSYTSKYLMTLAKFNKLNNKILGKNHELAGYTFFTRPTLNLQEPSLKMDRIMLPLNTLDPGSIAFSIRCYLDSMFTNGVFTTKNSMENRGFARQCPFFNENSAFIIPMSNLLSTISGFPDPSIDTETSDPGHYNEDQTIAIGSDFGNRTYDISIEFHEIQGGYIFGLLYYWMRYISLVTRGITTPYPYMISNRILDYTCSIYRFILDPSRRYITKWAKLTGCFPVNMNIGSMFNISDGEHYLHSTENVSVNFKVNHVEYMDPIILKEFNVITKRYFPNIDSQIKTTVSLENNFTGVPYIDTDSGLNQIYFMAYPEELENTEEQELQTATQKLRDFQNNQSNMSRLNNL